MDKDNDYKLDFFQAMEALRMGVIAENNLFYKIIYKLDEDGSLLSRGKCAPTEEWRRSGLTVNELIKHKWRIVEPKKCWLDAFVEERQAEVNLGREAESYFRSGAINLAREAIKRIEDKPHYVSTSSEYHRGLADAIEILKNVIGEK